MCALWDCLLVVLRQRVRRCLTKPLRTASDTPTPIRVWGVFSGTPPPPSLGAAKGKQPNPEALCQRPPPPMSNECLAQRTLPFGPSFFGTPPSPPPFEIPPPPQETPPPSGWPRQMGLNRGPPPPGTALADASPGEGAIRMGQQYHCHTKCYTPGAAVSVMSSGKPHQSQYLQTWSCGLVAQP